MSRAHHSPDTLSPSQRNPQQHDNCNAYRQDTLLSRQHRSLR